VQAPDWPEPRALRSRDPFPARVAAVLFDVDFTLIRPGPMFQGGGYQAFCARHRIGVDPAAFDAAVASAALLLDDPDGSAYDAEVFVAYTRHIIERMGGVGAGTPEAIDACAREIYAAWAENRHFELYEDVPAALQRLNEAGIRVGLVSNSHRCLDSFQAHFELRHLVSAAVSSADHGYMKPHPSIFRSALAELDVAPAHAVMVGDSLQHDVEGALNVGMRAVWLHRGAGEDWKYATVQDTSVPVIGSLDQLPAVLAAPR
jgi:putative hydrolase of the HAD superfamily